jgi:SpoVK/Ycf46/Vps4 family AAA+-type ATPase
MSDSNDSPNKNKLKTLPRPSRSPFANYVPPPSFPPPPSSSTKQKRKSVESDEDIEVQTTKRKKKEPPPREVVFKKDTKELILDHTKSTEFTLHYDFSIESMDDLLFLSEYYPQVDKGKVSNINFYAIRRIAPSLKKLSLMIGLEGVKKQLFSMIVYHLQRFEKKNQDMLHSVVYGGPGVGKTKFITILGEIYASLGVLEHGKVHFVKRSDLVGQYLGHTAVKTRKVIEEAKGGVLVIDEAYSLGDTEGRDSFSRECIDTLNQFLSEKKQDFVCIIAGYKEDLEQRFFRSNPGLERRFPFRFSIPDYNPKQLKDILISIVEENGWSIDKDELPLSWFEDNKDYFTFNGGDMEIIFTKAKFAHSIRVFSDHKDQKKKLTRKDIEQGLKEFLDTDNVKKRKQVNEMISWMYL